MATYRADALGAIHVTGADAEKFLQGQLTADVTSLTANTWCYTAHCDAKGKALSVARLCPLADGFMLLQGRGSIDSSLQQLNKFAVFSQVSLQDVSNDYDFVLDLDTPLPEFTVQQNRIGLGDASLLIAESGKSAASVDNAAWQRYEIRHGVPCLDEATVAQYVPQMMGLNKLDAINYKKGCYIGQETIARMHYLGQNKRDAYYLQGPADAVVPPGTVIERQIGDSWRRAGAVLNAVRYDSNEIAVLAVLPADIEDDAIFRIKGDEHSQLTLRPTFDNQEI